MIGGTDNEKNQKYKHSLINYLFYIIEETLRMKKIEEKFPYLWLLLGLVLALFSYGIFNTGICAWLFAIVLN